MAYPTAKSNDREGGSPSKKESDQVGDYMDATKDQDDDDADDHGSPYVDRAHPHQDASNRKPGDHPHKDLVRK